MQRMLWTHAVVLLAGLGLAACSSNGGGPDTTNNQPDARTDGGSNQPDVQGTDVQGSDVQGTDVQMMTCTGNVMGCNPVTNGGCMTGQACVITSNTMAACMPAGTAGFGDDCTTANCREGMACLMDPGIGLRCHVLCCGSDDVDRCRDETHGGRPGALCNINITGTGLFACSTPTHCDYHTQDCAGGQNCLPIDNSGTVDCVSAGTVAEGQPCMSLNACMRGFICVGPSADMSTCRRICNPMAGDGGTTGCASTERCGGVTGAPADFGVCVPM